MDDDEQEFITREGDALKIKAIEPELGKSYTLFGYITKIIDESPDNFTIQINDDISLKIKLNKDRQNADAMIDAIKKRSFEPGYFISELTNLEPKEGFCVRIIFGKQKTELDA